MEIQGFPDYLIYPDGRVWSKKRNKFLKPQEDLKGYFRIGLRNNEIYKTLKIHRLVAIHHIPNIENKPQVDHIDRDKKNNNVENLRWATNGENQENKGMRNDNKSGHKNICWDKSRKKWKFQMRGRNKIQKRFKSKIDCICYKFIFNLKTACNIR